MSYGGCPVPICVSVSGCRLGRVNAIPERFLQLRRELADDELALDCGSGGRKTAGVISLDVGPFFETEIVGDGMHLPFRDGAFGLVLSQAVIEHVIRPEAYVDEIFRVLRPGGLFYAEVAFMQPVHMAPDHYFNVTPFGLRWLCRRFDILDEGTVGWFQETLAWQCRTVGVKAPHVEEPDDRLRHLSASGVTILARRPV